MRQAAPPPPPRALVPSWFRPWRQLLAFILSWLLMSLDRGALNSASVVGAPRTADDPDGSGVMGQFGLDYFQSSLIPVAYVVGVILGSPLFAAAARRWCMYKLMGVAGVLWLGSLLAAAAAFAYWWLLLMRVLAGLALASVLTLQPVLINASAPEAQQAMLLGIWGISPLVGHALGYIVAGALVGATGSWRTPLYVLGSLMLPFAVAAFAVPPVRLAPTPPSHAKDHDDGAPLAAAAGPGAAAPGEWGAFWRELWEVVTHVVWLLMALGYTLWEGAVVTSAFFFPRAITQLFSAPAQTTDLFFGVIIVGAGVAACVGAGFLVGLMGGKLRDANVVCAASSCAGGAILIAAWQLAGSFATMMGLLACANVFALAAPGAAVAGSLWAVPTRLHTQAVGLQNVIMFAVGDIPVPLLIGLLQQSIGGSALEADEPDSWRTSMAVTASLLLPAGLLFSLAALLSTPERDINKGELNQLVQP